MVYPIRKSSDEAVQNAVFDYLNLNRHMFDKNGAFNPRRSGQDYMPKELVRFDPLLGGGVVAQLVEMAKKKRDPLRDHETWEEENARIDSYNFDKRGRSLRHKPEKCAELYAQEKSRCHNRWTVWPFSEWFPQARGDCIARARQRFEWCVRNKHVPKHIREYDGYDAADQPRGKKGDPDRTRPQTPPPPNPEDKPEKSKRVMAGETVDMNSMATAALRAYLAYNPFVASAYGNPTDLSTLMRKFVLLRSDYPEVVRPLTDYSPSPLLQSALSINPLIGPAGMVTRLPVFAPR